MNHKFQSRFEKKKFLPQNLEWGRKKIKLRSFWTRKMCIRHRAIDVINNWLKTNTIQTVEAFTHATCGENNLAFVFIAIAQHISFSIWNFITLAHPYIQTVAPRSTFHHTNIIMQSKSVSVFRLCELLANTSADTKRKHMKWNERKSYKKMLSKPYE